MLKQLRIILAISVVALASYSLITGNHRFMDGMMVLLGGLLIVVGIAELKSGRKEVAVLNIAASLFIIFIVLQAFFLN
ncbi:DUF3953 domain-containing protein [Metabacillus iocasae]|uniref:DUF3953 domain-containing protein n=1 Tax=Priestia iocasae TaxID=2291674 RepID=A0ABS2QTT5_9BACI|nr:DUF3953 domain-containing protein [Metabacillus iocasae]MBM7702412.1 hypothetical protein [Metabacillus iocasae]